MTVPSTGVPDSIIISMNDVNTLNKIMIDAKYLNVELDLSRKLIKSKDDIIKELNKEVEKLQNTIKDNEAYYVQEIKRRNYTLAAAGTLIIILLIAL